MVRQALLLCAVHVMRCMLFDCRSRAVTARPSVAEAVDFASCSFARILAIAIILIVGVPLAARVPAVSIKVISAERLNA